MMTEKQRTKANEISEDLMRPLTADEAAKRKALEPDLPRLRLRADTPTVEIDDATFVREVVNRLEGEGAIAIHETDAGATAVVLPVERYLELAGKELAGCTSGWVVAPNGRLAPNESALAASHIEQVDPSETWQRL